MSVWSPFASRVSKVVEIPGSGGATATIRKLGWKALEAAQLESQRRGIAMFREIGPGGLIKELQSAGGEDALREKAAKDPFLGYDAATLIERGVASWSFDEPITRALIEDLEKPVAEFLARQIFELSRPDTEADQKNA